MIWAHLIFAKSKRTLGTRLGTGVNEGQTAGTRWEWGFGKGQWKRAHKRFLKDSTLGGKFRTLYFIVGCRYVWDLDGSAADARKFYEGVHEGI